MKAFASYLLLPVMALAGWLLSEFTPEAQPLSKPAMSPLEPPPALGVVVPARGDQGPVRVRVDALLSPSGQKLGMGHSPVEPPQVVAILVEGRRKVAQINGMPMTTGERVGNYRIAAIESHRVLFEHPSLRHKRWVSVTEE